MNEIKNISEIVGIIISGFSAPFIAYIVFMGYLFRKGHKRGISRENSRRLNANKPVLRKILKDTEEEVPWKDSKLLVGGLKAFASVLSLISYVIFMMIVFNVEFSMNSISEITKLMGYPIVMIIWLICMKELLRLIIVRWIRLALTYGIFIALLYASYSLFDIMKSNMTDIAILKVELILLVVLSLISSYFRGTESGEKEADIENRFSKVKVVTNDDSSLEDLWLYENTEVDYRFISVNNIQLIIPHSNVRWIEYK